MIEARDDSFGYNKIAFGCSHTYGVGVEHNETWSYLLNAANFGQPAVSADFVVRNAPAVIEKYQPRTIYILWPDWTRFEYIQDSKYQQSLVTDRDRIKFMQSHPESWLLNNFQTQVKNMHDLCCTLNIQLIDMTLEDLIPYIDQADRWPVSKLGHHYSPVWHQWVADIFRKKNTMNKPDTLCMAPWTHTYLSPQTERRMCCASREPAQSFQQYIDTESGTGVYAPQTLDQWWNGDHMRSVRRRMLAGETLSECDVCNNKLLNTDVYRDYFTQLFRHKLPEVFESTSEDGTTTMKPVSWDYRFSNLCNFKCRMCGDMLSSSWETEQKQHNMINWHDPKNNWQRPEVRRQITAFQDSQIEAEFAEAVEQHRVEEIYWVGGEPLMYEQHWRYMRRIIELGDGKNVYARYNTNLSRTHYGDCNLFDDILAHVRDWQICASLDGTGTIGEYIRTGLSYSTWLENFRQGLSIARHRRQMRIDFTLTLPGMFEIENIQSLADELGVDVLAKVVFSFTPDIILSPLALPRDLLDNLVDQQLPKTSGALKDVLLQLKNRPTFAEQWPDTYHEGLVKGKARVLQLESIRKDTVTLDSILQPYRHIHAWYQSIA
ncbi:Radical_SAM domain containing protein [uncultured Caudovirales phage]|uniref:Radical_SAM domain containing protein n=1 Tax=uncultured Caudovirales phage TaxID=2100421 RepID=A0A6J5LTW5_9CAUD|nr:Radical_SAM domain containing protein [uncultured Caudovirales phage]